MNQLTQLCIPLFRRISEIWAFKQRGIEIPENQVLSEFREMFATFDEQCELSSVLKEQFETIKLPLVFFIDYIFKEGGFSYSKKWRELARDYDELSGDEKFFDLLEFVKNDATKIDLIEPFYIMLGLGFDGIFKRDPSLISRKMQECLALMPLSFDISKDIITEQPKSRIVNDSKKNLVHNVWFKVGIVATLSAIALVVNFISLNNATKDFSHSIANALQEAFPRVWVREPHEEDLRRREIITSIKLIDEATKETSVSKLQGEKQ